MATINGIEQGVSCYSYTQQFVEREDFGIDTIFRDRKSTRLNSSHLR